MGLNASNQVVDVGGAQSERTGRLIVVGDRLTKRDFDLLGRVFAAEIGGSLPAQVGKSRAVASLHERGLIEPMAKIFGRGPLPVTVKGWNLTQRGRIIYCENCEGAE
jgi:hypothetical protein